MDNLYSFSIKVVTQAKQGIYGHMYTGSGFCPHIIQLRWRRMAKKENLQHTYKHTTNIGEMGKIYTTFVVVRERRKHR